MGVVMNIQGDFEMEFKTLNGESINDPKLEKEISEKLETGAYFVTMARRKVVDYTGDDAVDVYSFELEPTDHTEYSYEFLNEL